MESDKQLIFDLVLETDKALKKADSFLDKLVEKSKSEGEKSGKIFGESFFATLNKELQKAKEAIKKNINDSLDNIGKTSLKSLNNDIKRFIQSTVDNIKQIPSQVGSSLMWFKKTILDFNLNQIIFGSFPTFVKTTFENFKSQAKSALNSLKNLPSNLYNLNLDKIFAGTGGFSNAIRSGIENLRSFGSILNNVAVQGIKGFNNLASTIGGGLQSGIINTGKALQSLSGSLGGIAKAGIFGGTIAGIGAGVGLAGMVTYATQLSSKLQGARISFETMLGNEKDARALLTDLTKFAKTTPFNRLQLIDLTSLLMGSGILKNEVIPTLTKLGNIASGSNAPIENLAYNYAQIKANNRAYTIDLKQFATYGIPIFDKIAKNMNITVEALRNGIDTKDIKVTFQDVENALNDMTSSGGQYFDLMGKKSKTFQGALSNIQDTVQSVLLKFMGVDDTGNIVAGGFFDLAQTKALQFQAWLNTNGEQIGSWGQIVFTKIGEGIQLAWTTIAKPALSDFQSWFETGGKESIKKFLSEGWERFANFLRYFGSDLYPNIIQPALKQFGDWLADPKRIQDAQNIVKAMGDISNAIMRVIEFANKATKAIGDVINNAKDLGQNAGSKGLEIQNKIRGFFGASPKEGRANGGTVIPGRLYEVGENNKAEMLMMNGRQYMIPGNKGQVLNQKQMFNQTDNRQINSGNQINYIYKDQYIQPTFSNLAYNY